MGRIPRLAPARPAFRARNARLAQNAGGFKLYPSLAPAGDDLFVRKVKYSAFIQGYFADVMTVDHALQRVVPVTAMA